MAFSTTALVATSLVTAAASTGASVYAEQQQASAQKATANYQAQVAENNAKLASQNSITAAAQGDAAVQQQYQRKTAQLAGARAAMGANGVQLDSGSALDVQGDIARTGQQNVQAAQYNGDVNAVSYLNQSINFENQASLDESEAENDATAGTLNSVATFITGASSVSSKWASYLQNNQKPNSTGAAA